MNDVYIGKVATYIGYICKIILAYCLEHHTVWCLQMSL